MKAGNEKKNGGEIPVVCGGSWFSSQTNPQMQVSEEDELDGGTGLTVGYAQSKWIAERILMIARARGVPVTIFRPGYVTGHSMFVFL